MLFSIILGYHHLYSSKLNFISNYKIIHILNFILLNSTLISKFILLILHFHFVIKQFVPKKILKFYIKLNNF